MQRSASLLFELPQKGQYFVSAEGFWVTRGILEAVIAGCPTGASIVETGLPIVGTGLSIVLGTVVAKPADIDLRVDPMIRRIKPTKVTGKPPMRKPEAVIIAALLASKSKLKSIHLEVTWPS